MIKPKNDSAIIRKQDQRSRVTRQMIEQAFLLLLDKKPVSAITVKELSELAQINRGTFYLHYLDIYDLLEKMEADILDELQAMLGEYSVITLEAKTDSPDTFATGLFHFFEKNRQLCSILLGENGDKSFIDKIIRMFHEQSIEEYMRLFDNTGREQADMFYYFIAHGFIGLLQFGLRAETTIPLQKIAESAEKITAYAVKFLINEQKQG